MHPRTSWWKRWIRPPVGRKEALVDSTRLVSEAMFHQLLADERIRSQRSGHLSRVVLIYTQEESGAVLPKKGAFSRQVMAVLAAGLRKTDYVGWYREGSIVSALLTVVDPEAFMGQGQFFERRVRNMLQARLGDLADSLRIEIRTPEDVQEVDSG